MIEFENDRVKVTRVRLGEHGPRSREDRLIIYLEDGHITRSEGSIWMETIEHKAGDVVWRPRSDHHIEHRGESHHVLIVELKE